MLTNTRQSPTMIITTTFVFTRQSVRLFQRHNAHTSEYKTWGPPEDGSRQHSVRWRPSRTKLTVNESLLPNVILQMHFDFTAIDQ